MMRDYEVAAALSRSKDLRERIEGKTKRKSASAVWASFSDEKQRAIKNALKNAGLLTGEHRRTADIAQSPLVQFLREKNDAYHRQKTDE
jgi:hypothetical protein